MASKYVSAGTNEILRTQSLSISNMCGLTHDRDNLTIIKCLFSGDAFLYGEVIKNGYGLSNGYSGAQNGWTSINDGFVKSTKKYIHIMAYDNTNKVYFKFPAKSYIEVYAR